MFNHTTVLLNEAVEGLNIKPDGIYVDCTLGGAGHSALIASKLGNKGKLFSFDQDETALVAAKERMSEYGDKVCLIKANFKYINEELKERGIDSVDGILFDLGVSSPQIDEGERGFTYKYDAPLDMRMDQKSDLSAKEIVNEWNENELIRILFQYGEEKFSKRIVHNIIEQRKLHTIETTGQLVEIIKESIPAPARRKGGHPAKRTFQAIRIAVNDELNIFETALEDSIELLNSNGRVSVITFHSLEDKICKKMFSKYAQGCTCPPDFPICVCGNKPTVKIVTKKPILPSNDELNVNRRSKSAKLRVAEKI